MKTAVIGGGAGGFFLAVNLKEMMPSMQVDIFERSQRVLAKVEVSGGGRCNCTNTFEEVGDLSTVYPRGHRLMKRLFNVFGPKDAYSWFERHGVPLVVQPDHCVFPAAQDSRVVVDCLVGAARRLGVRILTRHPIDKMDDLEGYDYVAVATGGSPRGQGLEWLRALGHDIEPPVPSLFSLGIGDKRLKALMGTVVEKASVQLATTKVRTSGPLLVTHWGLSGPAILRLTSHAARILHEHDYRMTLNINWCGISEAEARETLSQMAVAHRLKLLANAAPPDMTQRLWEYIVEKCMGERRTLRWVDIGKKDLNRLACTMVCDSIDTTGRAPFRDEFVTCGGVSLRSVQPTTLESRVRPHLYFVGEVLDIDGVTGGFNFQAAWTTAYTVAQAIANRG